MSLRKKEGLDGLKDTTGGKRRDDRQFMNKTFFDPLTVDVKNFVTVIRLLQSPEDNVRVRAIASLEVFWRKDEENLKLLQSQKILDLIFPLIYDPEFITRRFALKMIGMMSTLEEFREDLLNVDNVLTTFTDILSKETDAVLQEYSSLTLAHLSTKYQVASELLQMETCVETLLKRITSTDPDIEKNCLQIISHLLNDINGIEIFFESPSFNIKSILDLTTSSYPVIQALAIEVLQQLTSWCRDARVLFAFRDAMGIETILQILETREWWDLHSGALDLLINVADSPDLCDYLRESGCLQRLISFLDSSEETANIEKILGALARMSQSKKGRQALHSIDMEKRFSAYLKTGNDCIQEPSCLGIANLGTYYLSLNALLESNSMNSLLDVTMNNDKSLRLRNLAAYAMNILSNADKRALEVLLHNNSYKGLFVILTNSSNLCTELCQNVIRVFIGICRDDKLRNEVISESFFSALMSCLPTEKEFLKDPSLQVDVLECLSEYLIESKARALFHELQGTDTVLRCLKSKFAAVREWAGHLVVVASQNKDFVKEFILKGGLDWMLKEKNTMYSMPSWQSAIETIFANYLPAKFAYTGRLDFQDITQEGFYIALNPRTKFVILDTLVENMICPVSVMYVANFNIPNSVSEKSVTSSVKSGPDPETTKSESAKNLKAPIKSAQEEIVWQSSVNTFSSIDREEITKKNSSCTSVLTSYLPDPFLNEYLQNLKKRIAKEETSFGDVAWHHIHPKLIRKRAKIIAEFVAEELSGADPDPTCGANLKIAHLNELKYHLETNIIPLGYLREGDYLERAMLFKVLADRIGFPCAFVRGQYGKAWIEIAVPVITIEDPESGRYREKPVNLTPEPEYSSETTITNESAKCGSLRDVRCSEGNLPGEGLSFPKFRFLSYNSFPSNFLKPNAIVDLVREPGRILNINSLEAEEYCGAFLFSYIK